MQEQVIQWIIADSRSQLSENDRRTLNAWRSEHPTHEQLYLALLEVWTVSGEVSPDELPNPEAAWERFASQTIDKPVPAIGKKSSNLFWLRAAAILVAVIGIGLWTFRNQLGFVQEHTVIVLAAPEDSTFDLADGSRVFLKSGSQIDIVSDLMKDRERRVRLSGSAFFEIQPDAQRPFSIEVDDRIIQVLGTSFHVRSNETELDVVVRDGHVAVSRQDQMDLVDLLAQEHYHLDRISGQAIVDTDPSGNAWSWQSGILEFYAMPLEEVLADIERHYQIQVRLANPSNRSCRFTSRFNNADASTVLQSIAGSFDMELRSSGQGIYYLTDGKCR